MPKSHISLVLQEKTGRTAKLKTRYVPTKQVQPYLYYIWLPWWIIGVLIACDNVAKLHFLYFVFWVWNSSAPVEEMWSVLLNEPTSTLQYLRCISSPAGQLLWLVKEVKLGSRQQVVAQVTVPLKHCNKIFVTPGTQQWVSADLLPFS